MKKTTGFLVIAAAIVMFFDCASNTKTSAGAAAPSDASGGGGPKTKYVAVVETDIDAQSGAAAELNPAEVRQITAALRKEAVENLPRGTYRIMTSETVQSMGGAVLEECADENCVITLGAKIGADYIVRGTISKFGTKFTVSAEMYETDNGTLVAASDYINADNAAELMNKTVAASANMFRKFVNPQGGAVAQKQEQQTVKQEAAPIYRKSQIDSSGILTDSRDGKKYKTAVIGEKRWMGENMNYLPESDGSWCYENDNTYCDKYGRLYDWKTAQTVCPKGFHLPSRKEWQSLVDYAGGTKIAGKKLRAKTGWDRKGNGTDDYGFSALAGGYRASDGSFHYGAFDGGDNGGWWTSTEYSGGKAYYRETSYHTDYLNEDDCNKDNAFSVRCVQD